MREGHFAIATAVLASLVIPTLFAFKYVKRSLLLRRTTGKSVAVILSASFDLIFQEAQTHTQNAQGCGYLDGSESTETISLLVSLAGLGLKVRVFTPEGHQRDVVDHQSMKALGYAPRNMQQEAARLSRGDVQLVSELNPTEFDALFIPGGFGVAKNLSNWAVATSPQECVVHKDVQRVMDAFHESKKPMGLCCIAPILACVLWKNVKVTLGGKGDSWPYAGTIGQVETLGAHHVECNTLSDVCVDTENKIVTTPAFMSGVASKYDVFCGVRNMVEAVAWLMP